MVPAYSILSLSVFESERSEFVTPDIQVSIGYANLERLLDYE